jgi:hypothetical protein
MRRAFARVGAARRLVASRLLQLAKIDGRLKDLRPLSRSRLLSGPNNASFPLVALCVSVANGESFAAVRAGASARQEFVRLVLAMPRTRPQRHRRGRSNRPMRASNGPRPYWPIRLFLFRACSGAGPPPRDSRCVCAKAHYCRRPFCFVHSERVCGVSKERACRLEQAMGRSASEFYRRRVS